MCRAVSSSSSATPTPIRNVCAEGNCRELCRSRALGRAQCPPDRHRHARLPFVANDGGVWQRPRPSTWKTVRRRLGTPEHIVYIFPLWLGTMPALLKRVPRTGDAFGHRLFKSRAGQGRQDLAQRLGTGARDHAFLYRVWYLGHGIACMRRNILHFVASVRGKRERCTQQPRTKNTCRSGEYGVTHESSSGFLQSHELCHQAIQMPT